MCECWLCSTAMWPSQARLHLFSARRLLFTEHWDCIREFETVLYSPNVSRRMAFVSSEEDDDLPHSQDDRLKTAIIEITDFEMPDEGPYWTCKNGTHDEVMIDECFSLKQGRFLHRRLYKPLLRRWRRYRMLKWIKPVKFRILVVSRYHAALHTMLNFFDERASLQPAPL